MKKTIKYYVKVDYDYDDFMRPIYRKSESSASFEHSWQAENFIEGFENEHPKNMSNFQFSIHKFWEC